MNVYVYVYVFKIMFIFNLVFYNSVFALLQFLLVLISSLAQYAHNFVSFVSF